MITQEVLTQLDANRHYWKHTIEQNQAPVARATIYQESILGPRGGAAIATEAMSRIMQEKLGLHMAVSTLTPQVDITPFPFAVDWMNKPTGVDGTQLNNEEMAEVLGSDPLYIEYAMRLMNGTEVIMPNYWVAGTLAVRARDEMRQRQEANMPLYYDNGIPVYARSIPKVLYCNHSLPGRVDELLTQRAANGAPIKPMDARRHAFQEEVYAKADAIIVWTDAEKELSREAYPDMPHIAEKMVKVTPPFHYDAQKAHTERCALRQRYLGDLATDDTLVYYFQGRLVDYKRPDIVVQGFIDTYKTLYEQTGTEPDIACVIVGDGQMEGELQKMIGTLDQSIAHRIKLIGRQEPHVGHSLGDIQVNPTIKESFGYSNVEAAMTGRAVISTDIGTVVEANGPGGIYAHDQAGYTEAMIRLADQTEKQRHVDQLVAYTQRYTEDTTAQDLYNALIKIGVYAS